MADCRTVAFAGLRRFGLAADTHRRSRSFPHLRDDRPGRPPPACGGVLLFRSRTARAIEPIRNCSRSPGADALDPARSTGPLRSPMPRAGRGNARPSLQRLPHFDILQFDRGTIGVMNRSARPVVLGSPLGPAAVRPGPRLTRGKHVMSVATPSHADPHGIEAFAWQSSGLGWDPTKVQKPS